MTRDDAERRVRDAEALLTEELAVFKGSEPTVAASDRLFDAVTNLDSHAQNLFEGYSFAADDERLPEFDDLVESTNRLIAEAFDAAASVPGSKAAITKAAMDRVGREMAGDWEGSNEPVVSDGSDGGPVWVPILSSGASPSGVWMRPGRSSQSDDQGDV